MDIITPTIIIVVIWFIVMLILTFLFGFWKIDHGGGPPTAPTPLCLPNKKEIYMNLRCWERLEQFLLEHRNTMTIEEIDLIEEAIRMLQDYDIELGI